MKRLNKFNVSAFFISCLLPILVIVLGIIRGCTGTIFNKTIVLSCVIIPVFASLLFLLINFSKIRNVIKIVLDVIINILFVFLAMVITLIGNTEKIVCYENQLVSGNYTDLSINMPKLTEIGEPEKIQYYDYEGVGFIFFDRYSDTLICQYNDEEYMNQKKYIEDNYVFQSEPMTAFEHSCQAEIEIDDYYFRALSIEEYDMYYPKQISFIATNDETKEIVYMSIRDDDLDYLESLEEFINTDCGWRYIR